MIGGSRVRSGQPVQPARRHGVCAVCRGAITYYPRGRGDMAPRGLSIDDRRWSHDILADWIGAPHQARPHHISDHHGICEGQGRRGLVAECPYPTAGAVAL